MPRNLAHIAGMAFNEPLMLEPAYARTFFSALGKEIGADSIAIPQKAEMLLPDDMKEATASFSSDGGRVSRPYRVENGIAVVPVVGTLVHKLGTMKPYSGMTGYDGITKNLQMAIADADVKGIMLDIDSPGGQVAGAFDCADMIARMRQKKPIWALSNDMACSAAMLIASACTRRMVTQTGRMGSIGVLMAHASYAGQLEKRGVDITLIFSGGHKVDGNPYESLPEAVRAEFQAKMDTARKMFAGKVAAYTGLSEKKILDTQAAVYDGKESISQGLANELVNSADALEIMSSTLKTKGSSMTTNTERERIMGIVSGPQAKGREELANVLAFKTDLTTEQAAEVLEAVPLADALPTQETAAAIAEYAKSPKRSRHGSTDALVTTLSGVPGMTEATAQRILDSAPCASNDGGKAWVDWMNANNIPAVGAEGEDAGGENTRMNTQKAIAALHNQQG